MTEMLKALRHDPALAQELASRAPELSVEMEQSRSIDQVLEQSVNRHQERDHGLSL